MRDWQQQNCLYSPLPERVAAMNTYVYVVIGYTMDGRDDTDWIVAVYPEEQPAMLHVEFLSRLFQWPLVSAMGSEAANHLDPQHGNFGAAYFSYKVEKKPFVRHPDEFIERNGGGI